MAEKTVKLTVQQICNELKFNKNTRDYVGHKYKNKEFTLKQWKSNFEKDKLALN